MVTCTCKSGILPQESALVLGQTADQTGDWLQTALQHHAVTWSQNLQKKTINAVPDFKRKVGRPATASSSVLVTALKMPYAMQTTLL